MVLDQLSDPVCAMEDEKSHGCSRIETETLRSLMGLCRDTERGYEYTLHQQPTVRIKIFPREPGCEGIFSVIDSLYYGSS
ncbi:hypothetical protein R1flu_028988 [Riccia fluitans]|uniref:Uncharacterized protein n=1 Tax=Riccia fluitans TaxID=41844 RepID=A0ABD1XN84_9MARC